LIPLSIELLFPPRLQETAESDLEGVPLLGVVFPLLLFEVTLPSEVPPLITVVELGVDGSINDSSGSSTTNLVILAMLALVVRLPNLPPSAADIGTCSSPLMPS
jgi:hypothetical protein